MIILDSKNWRIGLLALILRVSVFLGFLVYLPSLYIAIKFGFSTMAVIDTIAILAVLALNYFDGIMFTWRATAFCSIFYLLGTGLLISVGSISQIYLFAFSILTTILFGLRIGLCSTLLAAITMLLVGIMGYSSPEMVTHNWNDTLMGWLVITLNFAFINGLMTLAIGAVLRAIENALSREIASSTLLDQEHKLLRTLIDALPDVIYTKDLDGRYLISNPAALALVGRVNEDTITGRKTVFDLFPHNIAEPFHSDDLQVFSGHSILNKEERSIDSMGKSIQFLTSKLPLRNESGDIVGLIGISRDITGRKKLEEQLRQSQKMEAVGKLAAGIAHDFNNLLTIISGYCEILLNIPEWSASAREPVKAIVEAGGRAAALTRQLLAFSRQTILEPKVLDLNVVVAETSKMLRCLIGEDINFITVLTPALSHVLVDPGQLEQILMNLAVNARDAMPQGGKLTIETANVELNDDFAASHLDCKAGHYVMLSISDTGIGMSAEVMAHIFEPFYTTKGVGEGTGLGLAMVFGIVQQSGGCIRVNSKLNQGSTFKIYFPTVTAPLSKNSRSFSAIRKQGTETILLVEDEEGVRGLAIMSLKMHGYQVLAAKNGKDALDVVKTHQGTIDLLLTDVVMPNLSGPKLAETLRGTHPTIKLLFMSGYTDDTVVRHGLIHAKMAFLQKPFTPSRLVRKVREVLEEA